MNFEKNYHSVIVALSFSVHLKKILFEDCLIDRLNRVHRIRILRKIDFCIYWQQLLIKTK
jgi:hypothetical protein